MSGSKLLTVSCADLAATGRLAATLAHQCATGDCVLLRGELGAGKTAFARGFIQALCPGEEDITSPTFTLVQTYPCERGTVWHFDLYRLERREDIIETGLEEALETGIVIAEWPEVAAGEWPAEALDVAVAIGHNNERIFTFSGLPSAWESRLQALKDR